MRKAVLVSTALGGAMLLAVALVTVVMLKNPSSASKAAGLTTPITRTTAKASPAKAAATKTKKAKPTASPKPSKTAKSTATASPAAANSTSSELTVPAGWKLTFDPSFSGSTLDTSTWATCYDWATSPSVGCNNNPTEEKEWYVPSQVQVSDGLVNLVAQQEQTQGLSTSGASETYSCRSGMITSKPGFNFTYGLISITAKLPYGPGLWPALWLAATNDDWPPELDIMEHWYSEPQYKVYDHTVGTEYIGGPVPTPGNLSAGFNTFSLLWTADRVTWYVDGTQVFTTTDDVPQQAMYFIANVADDSTAVGACNGTMQISSVKVWQP